MLVEVRHLIFTNIRDATRVRSLMKTSEIVRVKDPEIILGVGEASWSLAAIPR